MDKYIIFKYRNGEVQILTAAEQEQSPTSMASKDLVIAQVIDDCTSREQAVWQAALHSIEWELVYASELLHCRLEESNWELVLEEIEQAEALHRLLLANSLASPLSGLRKLVHADSGTALWINSDDFNRNLASYNADGWEDPEQTSDPDPGSTPEQGSLDFQTNA